MGRRGPPPTPTKVLELRGTYRQDRHGDPADEPQAQPLTTLPSPPGFLDDVAVWEWNRIGPELIELKLLTNIDMGVFTAYCCSVARAVAAEKILKAEGFTIMNDFGTTLARPEVNIATKAWAEVRQFAAQLGLSPSARTRVRVSEPKAPKDDNPWEAVAR